MVNSRSTNIDAYFQIHALDIMGWQQLQNYGYLVDDSLHFATSDLMMEHMKKTLHSEWKVTDLGEPSKIVGIKVMQLYIYFSTEIY